MNGLTNFVRRRKGNVLFLKQTKDQRRRLRMVTLKQVGKVAGLGVLGFAIGRTIEATVRWVRGDEKVDECEEEDEEQEEEIEA